MSSDNGGLGTSRAGTLTAVPPLVMPGPYRAVTERLEELAHACGDRVALEAADGRLTYAELFERMTTLAAELAPLLEGAPTPGAPVGILAEQGVDSVAAMMAVLAAGHPYVPMDVELPEARLRQIAEIGQVALVLADDARLALAENFPGVRWVRGLRPSGVAAGDRPAVEPSLDAPAALLFTSGSTGVPKGVVYTQRTALAVGFTNAAGFRTTPCDRIAMILPQAFAAGQLVMYEGLLNGATLVLRDPRIHGIRDLVEWLTEVRVSILHCTPSLLRAITHALPEGTVLDSIRLVTTAGEKINGRDVAAIRPYLPGDASFMNWLGSSETESLSTYEVKGSDPVPDGVLPAGHALPLRQFTIIGEDGRPVPTGTSGVLHVTSAFLSGGYWQDPERTAQYFTPQPDGRTTFRTGDRARLDEDGVLHLLGRVDDAVKIRGYLVEPQEIESMLLAFPEVADAVVRGIGEDDEPKRIVAWVVPDPQHEVTPSPASVRSTLARSLPDYMVPTTVLMLDAIPRNERGKVAVRELPAPPPRPEPVPARTDTERRVAEIWAPILRLDTVGRDESFTALGGDSLAVEEMLAGVDAAFGVSLTSADLAEHPSLADFAAHVDTGRAGASVRRTEPMVRLRAGGERTPLFCFAGAGGGAALFEYLAGELGEDQPVYAFQVNGFENQGLPDWTIGAAARRYVRLIERVAPTGPVVLAGHSLGGLFALRVAQLLAARGRELPLVAILDTVVPPAGRLDGTSLRARWQRSRAGLVGSVLYNFLVPTSVRRAQRLRSGIQPPRVAGPRPKRAYLQTRLAILTAGLTTPDDPTVRKDVFNLHGIGITQFHRPRPWPGRTLVFFSDENQDDPRWWDALLPGRHEFHRVTANHVAMLKPPFVRQITGPLAAAIADAGGPEQGSR